MKKALLGMTLLVLAAPALAADNDIQVPALTPIPFVVSTAGDITYGYVTNWGSLADEKGAKPKLASQVAIQLQQGKCAFNFEASRGANGRLQPKEGVANLACSQPDGSVIVNVVPGFILDKAGDQGLKTGEVGEKAFFIPQTAVRVLQDA
ncbi:MAG: hypothetical protein ACNJA3_28200 (plasmid) [Pseudomonas rhizophila]|uniref:hypothetical protein n=1 Tax=Pseudomonas rhizophila TaxID=2045200 RepID=UPI003F6B966A